MSDAHDDPWLDVALRWRRRRVRRNIVLLAAIAGAVVLGNLVERARPEPSTRSWGKSFAVWPEGNETWRVISTVDWMRDRDPFPAATVDVGLLTSEEDFLLFGHRVGPCRIEDRVAIHVNALVGHHRPPTPESVAHAANATVDHLVVEDDEVRTVVEDPRTARIDGPTTVSFLLVRHQPVAYARIFIAAGLYVAAVVLGVLLLVGLVRWDRLQHATIRARKGRPICVRCRHELRPENMRCPECGLGR